MVQVQASKEVRMNALHETEGAGVDAHVAYADGEHLSGATTQVPPPFPSPDGRSA